MSAEFLPPPVGGAELLTRLQAESGQDVDEVLRRRVHVPLDHMPPMKSIRELRGHGEDLARERTVVEPAAQVTTRRSGPRPLPEHVAALADDLATAREGLRAGDPERVAILVVEGRMALIENQLRNLAAAMGGQR